MSTSREQRLYAQDYQQDPLKTLTDGRSRLPVLRYLDGPLLTQSGAVKDGVRVSGQEITFDMSKLYPDDVMGIVRDMYEYLNRNKPDFNNRTIIRHLNNAIREADRRAVRIHGYSCAPEERDLALPYGDIYADCEQNLEMASNDANVESTWFSVNKNDPDDVEKKMGQIHAYLERKAPNPYNKEHCRKIRKQIAHAGHHTTYGLGCEGFSIYVDISVDK
jgi:hypothetical protein